MPPKETCANCDRIVGRLEDVFVWKDSTVCSECYQRLSAADTPKEVQSTHDEQHKDITIKLGGEDKTGCFTPALAAAGLVLGIIVGVDWVSDPVIGGMLGAVAGGGYWRSHWLCY